MDKLLTIGEKESKHSIQGIETKKKNFFLSLHHIGTFSFFFTILSTKMMSDDVCMYVCTHYQIMCKRKTMAILRITHIHIQFVYYHSSNIVLLVELYEKKRICVSSR
jgi:hypothetical protein